MTTTFPVDNRNILNEADATTGWVATDGPTLFTAAPDPIETTGCLAMQVSNAVENAYLPITADDYSLGGTLSIWMQDRAAFETTANVGIGIQVGDGTNRIAYSVGGSDGTAFRHDVGPVKWACFLLDLANKPTDFVVLTGVEANLDETAIDDVGVYYETIVKSVGGADNCFWDIIRWADNGDDVVMQGGTTAGAAGNGEEAAAVDRAVGNQQAYGVIRELAAGVYGIQGNLTIGNSASATAQFWEETNVTYAWEDRSLSDRNYYRMNFIGRTAQTSSIIFTASTLSVPSTTNARLDANGADLDVVTFDACTFLGFNVGIIGSDDTGDNWSGCAYIGCAALEVNGCDHTGSDFSGGLVCALIEAQDETSYDNTATEGSFTAGSGYAATDTIVMSNGQTITVDTVSTGAVTEFTVTTSEGYPAYPAHTLTQASTSGSGTGFELWPRSANLAEGGSMFYDLAVDPDGEIDNSSFTMGSADTHAIVFGPNIPSAITLRDVTFTGYGGTNNQPDSTLHFLDTTGTITVNIIGGTTPTYKTEGATIVIANSVTVLVGGVTEGAAVKVVADETVGTVTAGDTLGEGLANDSGEFSFSLDYEAAFEPSGLDVIVRARASGLPAGVLQDDDGVYTDETDAANSATDDDMNFFPATPVVTADSYMFGHPEEFTALKLDISTAGTGGFGVTWEYFAGTWIALSVLTDETSDLSVTGTGLLVEWSDPAPWTTIKIGGLGPFNWVRARYTSGTVTINPVGRKCKLDVTKYLPFVQNRTITNEGLTVVASWVEDTIATF